MQAQKDMQLNFSVLTRAKGCQLDNLSLVLRQVVGKDAKYTVRWSFSILRVVEPKTFHI
jgi:hypothetical protein